MAQSVKVLLPCIIVGSTFAGSDLLSKTGEFAWTTAKSLSQDER